MSSATSAAAVSTPGVLIRQSTSTLRPLPPARLRLILPSGTARPLRVTTAPRRLPVTAQSAANPGYLPESEFYKDRGHPQAVEGAARVLGLVGDGDQRCDGVGRPGIWGAGRVNGAAWRVRIFRRHVYC